MPRLLNHLVLPIGILLAIAVMERSCLAQDYSGNGLGNNPMSPAAPASSRNFERPVVPGPPAQPPVASRPSAWPDAQPEASPWSPPAQMPPADAVPVGELQPCGRIIARLGQEAILESDIIGAVNEVIEANKGRIPPDQLDAQRELLIRQRLKNIIPTKLIFLDAKHSIPSEGWTHVEKQLTKQFEEVQLEKMMKKAGVDSARELDKKLHLLGTSLEREKRSFIERAVAEQWGRQQVKRDEEITYDQMLGYYHLHQDEFTTPARARWEELVVLYSKHPNKAAAYDAIARMGNQILAGAPFAAVAKAGSDGVEAAKGGGRDWTTKGALACQALDTALFGLPVGQMSQIIEGPAGFHIIRVIERNDERIAPFLEAQVEIREKIVKQRSEKQFREYLAKLEAKTPVWTIFDNESVTPQTASPQQPLRR